MPQFRNIVIRTLHLVEIGSTVNYKHSQPTVQGHMVKRRDYQAVIKSQYTKCAINDGVFSLYLSRAYS